MADTLCRIPFGLQVEEPFGARLDKINANADAYFEATKISAFFIADIGYAAYSGFRKMAVVANAALHGAVHKIEVA